MPVPENDARDFPEVGIEDPAEMERLREVGIGPATARVARRLGVVGFEALLALARELGDAIGDLLEYDPLALKTVADVIDLREAGVGSLDVYGYLRFGVADVGDVLWFVERGLRPNLLGVFTANSVEDGAVMAEYVAVVDDPSLIGFLLRNGLTDPDGWRELRDSGIDWDLVCGAVCLGHRTVPEIREAIAGGVDYRFNPGGSSSGFASPKDEWAYRTEMGE